MIKAVFISVLVAAATAQDLSGIPGCALVCALGAGKKAGCGSGDVKCFCSSSAALASAQACVQSSCSEADAKKAVTGAANLCASVGVAQPVEARSSPASGNNNSAASAPAASPAADNKSSSATDSTSCVTLSKATSASSGTQLTSSTSQPAIFTGAAAAMNGQVRGAGAMLAGAAIFAAAAL